MCQGTSQTDDQMTVMQKCVERTEQKERMQTDGKSRWGKKAHLR